MMLRVSTCTVLGFHTALALADVPQQINHQGVVSVNGTPFNGAGSFKFAIYDRGTGSNLWCNDDNDATGGPPNCAGAVGADPDDPVSIPVSNGVYSVRLGDTGLANTPDHVLTSSPYSHQAAFQPPIGSIIAWHKSADGVPTQLPHGWVECNGQFATDDPSTPVDERDVPNLNTASGYGGGRFLRGGATSGGMQDATGLFNGWQRGDVYVYNGASIPEGQGGFAGDADGVVLYTKERERMAVGSLAVLEENESCASARSICP
jgi:hypothetical protein